MRAPPSSAAAHRLQTDARLDLHGGTYASLDVRTFVGAAEEVRVRLLARLIAAFGGQSEPARLAKLESLLARLGEPEFRPTTLGGAIVQRREGEILVHREPGRKALPEIVLSPGEAAVWDLRFRVAADPELATPVIVAPLGRSGFAKLRQQLERDPEDSGTRRGDAARLLAGGYSAGRPGSGDPPWPAAAWTNQAMLCA